MEQWIDDDIKDYKSIFKEYSEVETAIGHCALSMAGILNGLWEMDHTEFYKYEKKMIWRAMRLFSKQCIAQINYALSCKNATKIKEKKEVIADIENSISQMMAVCKNIIDGIANAERQMYQSLSIATNVYALPPKLCAFYSSMLERVVALFSDGKSQYAFVIHPTLRSTIEAKILLEKRKKSGKVVVIYISESVIEHFNLVPICLMHEAFHVITKQERHRKFRAINFAENMMEYIERSLLLGISFTGVVNKESRIRKQFMNDRFGNIHELTRYWNSEEEWSQSLYSKKVEKELISKTRKYLLNVSNNLDELVLRYVNEGNTPQSYDVFQDNVKCAENLKNQLRQNLDCIILGNMVSKMADFLIFLYRETYADIACILTLALEAGQYDNAFIQSIQFSYDEDNYMDISKLAREYLVAKTVSKFLPENLGWKEFLVKLETQKDLVQTKMEGKSKLKGGQNADNYAIIQNITISETMLQRFQEYLSRCADDLHKRLQEMDAIKNFRMDMKNVITKGQDTILMEILLGNLNM